MVQEAKILRGNPLQRADVQPPLNYNESAGSVVTIFDRRNAGEQGVSSFRIQCRGANPLKYCINSVVTTTSFHGTIAGDGGTEGLGSVLDFDCEKQNIIFFTLMGDAAWQAAVTVNKKAGLWAQ